MTITSLTREFISTHPGMNFSRSIEKLEPQDRLYLVKFLDKHLKALDAPAQTLVQVEMEEINGESPVSETLPEGIVCAMLYDDGEAPATKSAFQVLSRGISTFKGTDVSSSTLLAKINQLRQRSLGSARTEAVQPQEIIDRLTAEIALKSAQIAKIQKFLETFPKEDAGEEFGQLLALREFFVACQGKGEDSLTPFSTHGFEAYEQFINGLTDFERELNKQLQYADKNGIRLQGGQFELRASSNFDTAETLAFRDRFAQMSGDEVARNRVYLQEILLPLLRGDVKRIEEKTRKYLVKFQEQESFLKRHLDNLQTRAPKVVEKKVQVEQAKKRLAIPQEIQGCERALGFVKKMQAEKDPVRLDAYLKFLSMTEHKSSHAMTILLSIVKELAKQKDRFNLETYMETNQIAFTDATTWKVYFNGQPSSRRSEAYIAWLSEFFPQMKASFEQELAVITPPVLPPAPPAPPTPPAPAPISISAAPAPLAIKSPTALCYLTPDVKERLNAIYARHAWQEVKTEKDAGFVYGNMYWVLKHSGKIQGGTPMNAGEEAFLGAPGSWCTASVSELESFRQRAVQELITGWRWVE
ncbi:MAG: hypothetical protein JSS61_06075 [Verrucomicrobia bacterium]|nr:hypothetical protein [Verrucomicrobiota bacterium]